METALSILAYMGNQLVGFIVGVGASIVATASFSKWANRRASNKYYSLLGIWVEFNDLLEERPFSICEFSLDRDNEIQFSGYSYDNHGKEHYHWWSIWTHIDRQKRLSYVYETEDVTKPGNKDEGFGCIFLQKNTPSNTWEVEHGYFMDMAEAKPRNTWMVRFDAVASRVGYNCDSEDKDDKRRLVNKLLRNKDDVSLQKFFGK